MKFLSAIAENFSKVKFGNRPWQRLLTRLKSYSVQKNGVIVNEIKIMPQYSPKKWKKYVEILLNLGNSQVFVNVEKHNFRHKKNNSDYREFYVVWFCFIKLGKHSFLNSKGCEDLQFH